MGFDCLANTIKACGIDMSKPNIQLALKEFLEHNELDTYCNLNSTMLSIHILQWMEEYVRQQHVAKTWKLKE
jgi:hypothetical protein